MNRLECPDRLENLINRKFRQFCIEAIPKKISTPKKKSDFEKKSGEKKTNVFGHFSKNEKSQQF